MPNYFERQMSAQNVTTEQVYSALRKCMDPEIPVNVVDLGLIYGVQVNPENNVDIKMTMTTRGCPLHDTLVSDVERYQPLKKGQVSKQDDGSLILINGKQQGFMINQAIVDFWHTCDGTKTINQLTDQFSTKLGLPRQQVEQEVVQLVQQLLEAELLKADH